jgi:hypothetical protein
VLPERTTDRESDKLHKRDYLDSSMTKDRRLAATPVLNLGPMCVRTLASNATGALLLTPTLPSRSMRTAFLSGQFGDGALSASGRYAMSALASERVHRRASCVARQNNQTGHDERHHPESKSLGAEGSISGQHATASKQSRRSGRACLI